MKTCSFIILLALMTATGFGHGEEAAIALSIAVPVLAPGKERSIVAFDRHSHFPVILTNTSGKPQRILMDGSSDGDAALSFEITDRSGKKSVARRPLRPWAKNMPHWRTLQPREGLASDVYFADSYKWQGFPHPVRYGDSETVTMRAVFDTVETGRVVSQPEEYVFENRMSTGPLPQKASQTAPAPGSQPVSSETNATPSAAGSRP